MGRRVAGVSAFVLLVFVAIASAWEQQPHGHRDGSAPATEFSADRAMSTVREIASTPHPVGTAEHDRVRDHLVGRLRDLGLDTEIRHGVGRIPLDRSVPTLGAVDNIVAHRPGTDSTGTLYLVAHYDSTPSGPGANDDAVGVATVLESVRALGATPLRNDLVVLLTDGEEAGLLGAEAFAASGAVDPRGAVAINHEARGAGGPPILWRISHPDGELIRSVATVPRPNTDSLSTALAGDQTSSHTDFSALDPAGMKVLDWAFAGRNAYYHNPFDDPAHVDPATVQQFGDNTLAQTRDFGARDLGALDDGDRAYTLLPFGVLLVLPPWVIVVLAAATVLLVAAVTWRMRRSGELTIGRSVGALVTAVLAVPLAMGAVYGLWQGIQAIRPEYRALFVDPYRPQFYQAAVIMACVAVLALWYALSRRWFGSGATAAGALGAVAVIGAALTAALPPSGAIVVVPAFVAAAGAAVALALPQRWRLPVLTLGVVPAAVLLGGTAFSALQSGLSGAAYLTAPVVTVLGVLFVLTLTHAWPERRGALVPAVAVLLTVALAVAGAVVDRFDDRHPLMSQLVYALDAEHHEAQWLSEQRPDRWTEKFVGTGLPPEQFAQLWDETTASGAAPDRQLPAPRIEKLSDTTESGRRQVRLRVWSARAAPSVALRYREPVESLRVAGREITPVPSQGFEFVAVPPEGIEVELTVPAGPLNLRVIDYSWLPDSGFADAPADIFYRQDSEVAVFTRVRW